MSMQKGESNLQVTKPTSREQRAIARAKRSATEEIDLLEENIKDDETSENKIKAEITEIGDLIKLLTLKFQKEAEQQKTKQAATSTENVGSVIGDFDGQSPVRVFENFEKCAAALKWSDNQKYVFARKKMTKTAKLFVDSICVFDYDTLRKEVEREFRRDFVSADIHKQLQERRKKSTESMHEYMLHMRRLGTFGKVDDPSIIRYIIDGINEKAENKTFLHAAKNFDDLKAMLEAYEKQIETKREAKANNGRNSSATESNKNKKSKREHCYNCGSTDHKRSECKEQTKCLGCNKTGHISKNCPSSTQKNNDVNLVHTVEQHQNMQKTVQINNIKVRCLIDSGAEISIIEQTVAKKLNCSLKKCCDSLSGYGNKKVIAIGRCEANITVDNLVCAHSFLVVPDNVSKYEVILGFDFIGKCEYIYDRSGYRFTKFLSENENWIHNISIENKELEVPKIYKNQKENIVKEYSPKTEVTSPMSMKIVLSKDKVIRHLPKRLPLPEQKVVSEQVEDWLQKKIIRPSSSEYCCRVVIADKTDGKKRLCVDFRDLNKIVQKDRFPVPLMEEVIEALEGASIFRTLDLENAFFHVSIEESSKKYTAFVTRDGIYEFNRAPFGFCNSPAMFLRFVTTSFVI